MARKQSQFPIIWTADRQGFVARIGNIKKFTYVSFQWAPFLASVKISEGVFYVFMGRTSTKSKYKLSDMKVRKRSILALKCTFGVQNRLKHTQLNEYV